MKKITLLLALSLMVTIAYGQKRKKDKDYYDNGQLSYVGYYYTVKIMFGAKEAKRDGEWLFYYENGVLHKKLIYDYGELIDTRYEYYKNGVLAEKETFGQNSKSNFTSYYNNGEYKSVGKKVYGHQVGKWNYYYENGNTWRVENYELGEGIVMSNSYKEGVYRRYFINGTLEESGAYHKGYKNGNWKLYFDNGSLSQTSSYKNDNPVGLLNRYNKEGKLIYTIDYDLIWSVVLKEEGNGGTSTKDTRELIDKSNSRNNKRATANAYYKLGGMFTTGTEGVRASAEKAFYYFSKGAEMGNSNAQYNLFVMYSNGQYVDKDLKQANIWLIKSAKQENTKAQFYLGMAYFKGGDLIGKDDTMAFNWLLKSANGGNKDAFNYVAIMYDQAIGVQQNFDNAIYWYIKAIDSDNQNSDALNNLAAIYINKGSEFISKANALPSDLTFDKKYTSLITESNLWYKKAIPYCEKYLKLNPEDETIKSTLIELHERTDKK